LGEPGVSTKKSIDSNKLYSGCFIDPTLGTFVDQKWMDFVPTIFSRFKDKEVRDILEVVENNFKKN